MAWGVTIHKAQGLTVGPDKPIKRIMINAGVVEHYAPGLMYVAISRAEYANCIAFNPMPTKERFEKLNCSLKAQATMAQLDRLDALDEMRRARL